MKIMSLSVGSIKIIDSFNYLPMALAIMPKTFGFDEMAKGYFPHLFNKKENWDYVGKYPDAFFYSPANMKKKEYDAFHTWYLQQKSKVNNSV